MIPLATQTRILFLVMRAIRNRHWGESLYQSLNLLANSQNAAIANQARMLTSSLTRD